MKVLNLMLVACACFLVTRRDGTARLRLADPARARRAA